MTTRICIKKVVICTLAVLLSAGAFIATATFVPAANHVAGSAKFAASVDDDGSPIDSKTISTESGDVTIDLMNLSEDGNPELPGLNSVSIRVNGDGLKIDNMTEGETYDVAGETVRFSSWDMISQSEGNEYVVRFDLLGDDGGGTAPVCGPVSLSNNDSLYVSASCNNGPDNCNSDSQSTTATHEFSGEGPLLEGTTVDVEVDISVEADGYDSRANARTTISLLDGSGNVIGEKEKSISVKNPPEKNVENSDSFKGEVSFSDAGGAEKISVNQSVSAYPGPGGINNHGPTSAEATANAVYVTVTSPSCGNNDPEADNDGTPGAGICTVSDGVTIDVLDNDGDENGNDFDKTDITIPPTTLTPSDGIAAVVDKDGVDRISYTPTVSGEDSFEYRAVFPNGTTDTAQVTLDVTDSACGNIEVSFASTGSDVNNLTGAKADPTYDYPGIGNLDSQKLTPERVEQAAASGQNQEQSHLSWNVPLEVATNTAELKPKPDYIEPPEGYQLAQSGSYGRDGPIVKENTETGKNFTGEATTAWLGEDYEPETPDVSDNGGTTESYTGYGYQSCHFCHTGDAYTYIESFEADVTETTYPDGTVDFSYNNEEYTGYDAVSGNSSACTQEIEENTVSCYDRWTKAKGNNDPTWDPPESYCPESGTESSCYPDTDWPESSDEGSGSSGDTSQTCDSYTVYEPYPNCPPGAEAKEYGYATCEKRCVRTASP